MPKIKLNALAQSLAKKRVESATLISGYAISQSGGMIEMALDLLGSKKVQIKEDDILHHTDGDSDSMPSTFVVRGEAELIVTRSVTANQLGEGDHECGCSGGTEPEEEIARQAKPTRAESIRHARCLGAYIGCTVSCAFDKYPDLCRSVCRNQYTRCQTPLVYF